MIERLLYVDPNTQEKVPLEKDIPFYSRQTRVLLAGNMLVDSTTIGDYIAIGGYEALAKVLSEMSPEDVISEVGKSGLRGRGGAGFSTATKWEACRQTPGSPKYLICNADEGDPGAYMDRSVLEGNPHSVLEGMLIGAYAIGAQRGYVYVRAEYPLAIEHLGIAIEQAREHGLLGVDILGTGFDFDVTHQPRGRRLRVRRGNRADGVDRGAARHAAPASAAPGGERPLGEADHHQQRGDLGQRADHRPQGR